MESDFQFGTAANPELAPCCREPENLVLEAPARGDLTMRRCRVCRRRHFRLTVDPGTLGVRGAVVGRPSGE